MGLLKEARDAGFDSCLDELGLDKEAGLPFRALNWGRDMASHGMSMLRGIGATADARKTLAVQRHAAGVKRYEGTLASNVGNGQRALSESDRAFAMQRLQQHQAGIKAARGRGVNPSNAGDVGNAGGAIPMGGSSSVNSTNALVPQGHGQGTLATIGNTSGGGNRTGGLRQWWGQRTHGQQLGIAAGGGVLAGYGAHGMLAGGQRPPPPPQYPYRG